MYDRGMTEHNRRKGIDRGIQFGLVFLVLASLAKVVSNRMSGWVAADAWDGGVGLLYGVSIGCMIAGLARLNSTKLPWCR